jgi:hypothetical protein
MNTKKLKRSIVTIPLTAAVVWTSGCASIITSGDRTISIASQPDAAMVTIYDVEKNVVATGATPARIKLKKGAGYFKGADYRLVIAKPGYQQQEIEIRHTINGWYFGNFLIGGLLGMVVVDPLTGGMWALKPDKVNVNLTPAATTENDLALPVVTINQLAPSQKAHLVPLASARTLWQKD